MDREKPQLTEDDLEDIARGTQEEFKHLEATRPLTIEEKAKYILQEVRNTLVEHFPEIKVLGDVDSRTRQMSPSEKLAYQQLRIRISIQDTDSDAEEVLKLAKEAVGGCVDEKFSLETKWVQEPSALIGVIEIHPIFSFSDDQK